MANLQTYRKSFGIYQAEDGMWHVFRKTTSRDLPNAPYEMLATPQKTEHDAESHLLKCAEHAAFWGVK